MNTRAESLQVNEGAAHAPDEIRRWAERITTAQGCHGVLAKEKSGYHLYIPCPECLLTHGRRELDDPKYSINLTMLAEKQGTPKRRTAVDIMLSMELEKKKEFGSSICMRTRSERTPHRFSIEQLLDMSTITERHPDIRTRASIAGAVGSADIEEMWEVDPISGKKVPPPPGEVVKLSALPPTHPAVLYLRGRDYDIAALENQFNCAFCLRQYPGEAKKIFYRKMPGGWRDTPQHRIVFYSMIGGAPLTWQARVIEKLSEDKLMKLMLHPYAGGYGRGVAVKEMTAQLRRASASDEDVLDIIEDEGGCWGYLWSRTHVRANTHPDSPWIPVAPFDELFEDTLRFKPSKYRTAKYSTRQMMGWDAALTRAAQDQDPIKWLVLCEGPLDAARVGPGGVALIGSSISPENAAKVTANFHVVFSGLDNDRAGVNATESVRKVLTSSQGKTSLLQAVIPLIIPLGKDLGDLSKETYEGVFSRATRTMRRAM